VGEGGEQLLQRKKKNRKGNENGHPEGDNKGKPPRTDALKGDRKKDKPRGAFSGTSSIKAREKARLRNQNGSNLTRAHGK